MITIAVFCIAALIVVRSFLTEDQPTYAGQADAEQLLIFVPEENVPSYTRWLSNSRSMNVAKTDISISSISYQSASEDAQLEIDRHSSGTDALYWNNDKGWVEYEVEVPEAGVYVLEIEYLPLKAGYSSIVRGVMVDGQYPFAEARHIELDRTWKDEKFQYDRDVIGHEIRPVQVEVEGWKKTVVANYGVSSEPLLFALSEGIHTVRFVGERGPVALNTIEFKTPQTYGDYKQYRQSKPDSQAKKWHSVIEAERYLQKSSTAIQTSHISEPYISPDPKGRLVYNVLGGERWRNSGEWVEWQLEVPESGWYEIDLKVQNRFRSYRTIMIDGQVPFREMLHYPIAANDNFRITPIQDAAGKPFQFYLEKGDHVIRMIADSEPTSYAQLALRHTMDELVVLDREIRLFTGNTGQGDGATKLNLDTTRTWEMNKYMPDIDQKLSVLIEQFRQTADYLEALNGRSTDITESIHVAIDMLEIMAHDVDEIPNRINDFSIIRNNIGNWLPTLSQQPLLMDYIVIRTPDAQTGLQEPTLLSRIPYSIVNFARTFYMDYDLSKKNKEGAITVWVQRGRDYADLLREMADQYFTPQTGIQVNINLMPNPNMLILGNAAGDVPDIALGISESTPADFAMRNAAAPLSQFDDFQEVYERFHPGAMRALAYQGETYGIPEVQNFLVLFYRTDIFEQLKLKVPDTWDDVYNILPTLQEKGMTMFYPTKDYLPFFYQNGEDFYSADGLTNNLGSNASVKAFKQWTDLYTKYYLPLETPVFFNHFRDGDMPIGIADFNTYVQLQVAAPEITGQWKIAPVPGVRQHDGEVARWTAQPISAAMIMKKSDKQEQAWEFLKWWTSYETQVRYSSDIESFYGMEFRWNTANLQAMSSLSWPQEDVRTIREQARWVKNAPYVPGYYYLGREMDFAWIRTVLERMPPLESLEMAEVSLQREMDRKQEGFGIGKEDDLRVPGLDQPYDWGNEHP